jgi:hypothetical protein
MTDYVVGATYELRQPAYFWNGVLMGRYLADSNGMLPAGSRLVVRRVVVERAPEMGTFTDIYAEILTGEQKGKTVSISFISRPSDKKGYVGRDPQMLSLVEETQHAR